MSVTPYTSLAPRNDFGLYISNLIYNVTVGVNDEGVLYIPSYSRRYKAVVTVTSNIMWSVNGAPKVLEVDAGQPPAGVPFEGNGGGGEGGVYTPKFFSTVNSQQLTAGNTYCREVKSGDILYFAANAASCLVNVCLYSLDCNN